MPTTERKRYSTTAPTTRLQPRIRIRDGRMKRPVHTSRRFPISRPVGICQSKVSRFLHSLHRGRDIRRPLPLPLVYGVRCSKRPLFSFLGG
jgi:hypothetical protein